MKVVADADIPFIRGVLEPYCEVTYLKGSEIGCNDVRDADALLVRTRTRCDRSLLAGSSVRLVATATAGCDHIDAAYCASAGIEVAAAPGSNARAVLQWYAAALAHLCEKFGIAPHATTIGVVGTGNVGSLVARYSAAWGFRVMCCDPPLERSGALPPAGDRFFPLGEIARTCDIVTFHTPLTLSGPDATHHMAGELFLGSLCRGALLINASRGEVVDTEALMQALETGQCSAAAIDTWEGEPSPDPRLIREAALATPHIAGYSIQGKANASAAAIRAVARRFGLPLGEWYPEQVRRVEPRTIEWEEMKNSIRDHFDIEAESAALKSRPEEFERLRSEYIYREEYF